MNFYKSQKLLFLLIFMLIVMGCRKKESSRINEQVITYLINQSLTQSNDACIGFAISESLCVIGTVDTAKTCSETEKSRLKRSIEPVEKQTNEILNKFFDCWKRCNLVFNSQESICSDSKFSNLETYRNIQKSGQSSASKNWIICINSCNQAEAEETKTSGAIFKGWAY